jgi:hypothetical protein
MALGLGVSSVRDDNNNKFGLTGVCSIGPVMAVLIYAAVIKSAIGTVVEPVESQSLNDLTKFADANLPLFSDFSQIAGHVFRESLISIAPLFALFVVFQIFLLKMTKRQVIRIIIGFVYAFIGLTVFLIGVNAGFSQAGAELGQKLGSLAVERGGAWYVLLIITGLVLGAIIVCAEPAVWVLSEQVESVSGGTIKRKVLLVFLSVGTAVAIALAMLRAISGFNLKYILIPGYILSMILMIFSPSLFSGIAFDSGGVASGPLTSTFVLSFTLGAAASGKGGNDSFGVIALVAMMPLLAIQIMGIIFKIKQNKSIKSQPVENTEEAADEL